MVDLSLGRVEVMEGNRNSRILVRAIEEENEVLDGLCLRVFFFLELWDLFSQGTERERGGLWLPSDRRGLGLGWFAGSSSNCRTALEQREIKLRAPHDYCCESPKVLRE